MQEFVVIVVRFSPAFGDLWRQLIEGLHADIQIIAPGDVAAVPRAAAVVLAAGGVEREAIEWLAAREHAPDVPVLVAGLDTGRRVATRAVSHGATDYYALPEDTELLRNAIVAAVARHPASGTGRGPTDAAVFQRIAGSSSVMKAVLGRAQQFAPHSQATALIIGEAGTGKELLARTIHDAGPRRHSPFVPVNCAAVASPVIDFDLFGYEPGVLAHAHVPKPGLFEVADGGTLFLDEVGELPMDLQDRLRRALDDREVRRMGATRRRLLNVRVIAATSAPLDRSVQRGTFRRDLYLKLGVVTLELPPLRGRGDDVVEIAEYLVQNLAALHELPVPVISAEARRALTEHTWPGNVRELRQALERALLLSPRGTLSTAEVRPVMERPVRPFSGPLDSLTAKTALATLETCGGNISEAARRLSISRARLRRLVQSAGLERLQETA